MAERARLLVLISGTGRNLQAIIDACQQNKINADLVAVISNRPHVEGLKRAEAAGIPGITLDHKAFESREAFDEALAEKIDAYRPDIIALAGFMRILTASFVKRFEGRMFNIHPSLLPKYQGLNTHQRALDAGDLEHGASIHYVTAELDGGPVVLQGKLDIQPGDTADRLAKRVMEEVELYIYPLVLAWAAERRLNLRDEGVRFDNQLLESPLLWKSQTKQ